MKRILTMFVAIALVAGLASCAQAPAGSGEAATQAASSTAASPAAAAPAANGEKIKMSIMDAEHSTLEEWEAAIRSYCDPNNIEIDIQHAATDYEQLLAARINSGQTPDVFLAWSGSHFNSLVEYALDLTGTPTIEKFNEDLLTFVKSEDRVMALPWFPNSCAIIYNKALFEQAGITELPQTIDELEALCQTLQAGGVTPFVCGWQSNWMLVQMSNPFTSRENGGNPVITGGQLNSGELTFGDMTYFRNLFSVIDLTTKYGVDKMMEYDTDRAKAAFANGEAAMYHDGMWAEPMIKEVNPDIEIAYLPIPITNEAGVTPMIMGGSAAGLMVNKDSEHVELALALADHVFTSDEGIAWASQAQGGIPATKKQPESYNGILTTDASAYSAEGLMLPWTMPMYPAGFDVQYGALLQSYAAGDIDAETCIQRIQEEWELSNELSAGA